MLVGEANGVFAAMAVLQGTGPESPVARVAFERSQSVLEEPGDPGWRRTKGVRRHALGALPVRSSLIVTGRRSVMERWKATRAEQTWWKRISWRIYLFYVSGQRDYARKYDPWTSYRFSLFPPYDPERAAIYHKHAEDRKSVV